MTAHMKKYAICQCVKKTNHLPVKDFLYSCWSSDSLGAPFPHLSSFHFVVLFYSIGTGCYSKLPKNFGCWRRKTFLRRLRILAMVNTPTSFASSLWVYVDQTNISYRWVLIIETSNFSTYFWSTRLDLQNQASKNWVLLSNVPVMGACSNQQKSVQCDEFWGGLAGLQIASLVSSPLESQGFNIVLDLQFAWSWTCWSLTGRWRQGQWKIHANWSQFYWPQGRLPCGFT